MRILVIGGTGFIGSALVARLTAEGHECLTVARRPSADARHIRIDIAKAVRPEDWNAALHHVDAACAAGCFQIGKKLVAE